MSANVRLIVITAFVTLLVVLLIINLSAGERRIERQIEHRHGVTDPQFMRSMGVLLGPAIVNGNKVEVLLNGDQIFPPMLAAIRSATKTITFETYIYWSESIGQEFADALSERARAGIKVHVLLDWIGSVKMEPKYLDQMRAAGIEIVRYHQPAWYNIARMNNRTHRKLLIVDGVVGFTGGVGIADQWLGNAQDPEHWRDTHFRAEGPVVAQMQAVFMDNWIKAKGTVLDHQPYFPAAPAVGSSPAQMFSSSPTNGSESMHLMYMLAITAAKSTIRLSSAYFVPDDLTIQSIIAAVRRGVRVEIIVPGTRIDSEIVRSASRARWGELLEAGVKMYEYQPTMYHCKVLVVDDYFVSVGSTNFDNRSFRLNDEANLNIYDASFAREQSRIFDEDRRRSREITFQQWRDRPLHERVLDRIASLFGAQF